MISEGEVLTIFAQICAAVGAIHAANIVHRDIKPENVFRTQNGRILLGDFGVCALTSGEPRQRAVVRPQQHHGHAGVHVARGAGGELSRDARAPRRSTCGRSDVCYMN